MTAISDRTSQLPSKLIGGGYSEFLSFKGRYRVCKGSRASKKSKTTALNLIYRMMKYPDANALVVRKTFRTLKDSCFTELQWAINRIGVADRWEAKQSPLELVYTNNDGNRQKIYFRGLDDPLKITSITVEHGCLCWLWLEEAYEITSEDDFNMLDESIRGAVPEGSGLFKQITLTLNPWNEKHWIKRRFFDNPDGETLAMTTNYLCNEWLDDSDRKVFESMKVNNPRRYAVAGLGEWGIVDGLVYENWGEHDYKLITKRDYMQLDEADRFNGTYVFKDNLHSVFGLDFGYTNDPTALFAGFIDLENRKIYVWDELYEKGCSNRRIYEAIVEMGYGKERITADSAEPKSIDELKGLGLRVRGAAKGRDSVNNGIQFIQGFEIIIHPRCTNFLTEISNYTWEKDKFGAKLNVPVDDFNHLMDAMRYGIEKFITSGKGWMY